MRLGCMYAQITWNDKRGRSHVVWKRYSRFLDLRIALAQKVPPVNDLPFPKKKVKKNKGSVVEERREVLQQFLQQLMLGDQVWQQFASSVDASTRTRLSLPVWLWLYRFVLAMNQSWHSSMRLCVAADGNARAVGRRGDDVVYFSLGRIRPLMRGKSLVVDQCNGIRI
jgi:small-conductance mechanosensitive channel